jgi:hypothetical protein
MPRKRSKSTEFLKGFLWLYGEFVVVILFTEEEEIAFLNYFEEEF